MKFQKFPPPKKIIIKTIEKRQFWEEQKMKFNIQAAGIIFELFFL